MTLVNVERIKLFTTRSPYWCLAAIVVASLGFSLLFALVENGEAAIPYLIMRGVGLGMSVFMVLAALAITTEYRFGTIRNTFLAAPRRVAVLAAKTVLLAALGGIVGLVCSIAAFYLAAALASDPPFPLELSAADEWRQVAGHAALYAIAAVIAVSIGTIVRQSAGAIAILLLWPLLVEQLFTLIPTIGPKVAPWLPFRAADAFVSPTSSVTNVFTTDSNAPGPIEGLLVFSATAAVLWVIAALLLTKRDA